MPNLEWSRDRVRGCMGQQGKLGAELGREGKGSTRWPSPPHYIHCSHLAGHINGEMIVNSVATANV